MQSQVTRLKGAQAFFLVLAILSAIMSIPLIGYLISITSFGLIHLLLLAFAIITLIFALRASAPRTGALLVMIAVIPGIVSAVLMFNGIRIADRLGLNIRAATDVYEAMHSGELTIFFVGFNIGIISWILYLLAAILLFLNVSNVRMRYKDLERGDSFLSEPAKKMRKTNTQLDEKVEQTMGFHFDYDEMMPNEEASAAAKIGKEEEIAKIETIKKGTVTDKKIKEKASKKAVAKTIKTTEKLPTAKSKQPLKTERASKNLQTTKKHNK